MFKCSKSSKSKTTGRKQASLYNSRAGKVLPWHLQVFVKFEETEKCFARLMAATSGRLPHGQGVPDSISIAVLRSLNIEEIFPELHEHMIDTYLSH